MIVCATLFASLVIAAVAGAAFVLGGVYDVSVTGQHTQSVYSLLEFTMARSVKRHARDVAEPSLGAEAQVQRGAACYRENCLQCHGGPGVAQGPIGLSMQPLPGPLTDATQRWRPRELYWLTRDGIKMSGMPAWRYRLPEADLWSVVAFLQVLPQLGPQQFKQVMASVPRCEEVPVDVAKSPGTTPDTAAAMPDAARGRLALHQHACSACHTIPGVAGAEVHVGPPLGGMARRELIAGQVPNTPEQMVRWIRNPQAIDPQTAMPMLGVSESSARDMAAYLATLR